MSREIACGEEDLEMMFSNACSHVREISSKLSEDQLLQFYGYYKQAVDGPCSKPQPSWYQMAEKQKWRVWSSLKNMDSKEAMRKYIDSLNNIDDNWHNCAVVEKKATAWVHHSSMENTDQKIEDSVKTVFDWVKENNLLKVQSLLDTNPDINGVDENNLTLLHWAADRGSLEIVKCLIQNFNADLNAIDGDGQTPLHYASFCDHEDVVKFLLESGADLNVKDFDGNMPCDVASNSNIKTILETFVKIN